MVDRGAESSAFGSDNYYFGSNIPGKPHRLLLNAGRPPEAPQDLRRLPRQRLRRVPPHLSVWTVCGAMAPQRVRTGVRRSRPG